MMSLDRKTEEDLRNESNAMRQRIAELEKTEAKSRGMEQAWEERLRFEELLFKLSARFVNLPAGRIDEEIEQGMKYIVNFLNVDRAIMWQQSPDDGMFYSSHSWQVDGIKSYPRVSGNTNFPTGIEYMRRDEVFMFSRQDNMPKMSSKEKEWYLKVGMKALLVIPLFIGGTLIGALAINVLRSEKDWPSELVDRLRLVGEVFANALERKRGEQMLEQSFAKIERLQNQLQLENFYLRREIKLEHEHRGILGKSDAIKRALRQVERVAKTDSTVLIQGETGTGKELIARAIHDLSPRKKRAMVKINCAALPPTLIESELFGREKGAFTGAVSAQAGRFEVADGSTIFLDEVGELSSYIQVKLLRVLQEGEFERLGSSKTIKVDARVIAATNRDLKEAVQKGLIRRDLYYRLNVFPILAPPLRERPEDIPVLVRHFTNQFGERMGKRVNTIPKKSMEAMMQYPWPGNVRELMNIIERAMILAEGSVLHVELGGTLEPSHEGTTNLKEIQRNHIRKIIDATGWRIRGKNGAAELLGLKPTTLESRLLKLGIKREK